MILSDINNKALTSLFPFLCAPSLYFFFVDIMDWATVSHLCRYTENRKILLQKLCLNSIQFMVCSVEQRFLAQLNLTKYKV